MGTTRISLRVKTRVAKTELTTTSRAKDANQSCTAKQDKQNNYERNNVVLT